MTQASGSVFSDMLTWMTKNGKETVVKVPQQVLKFLQDNPTQRIKNFMQEIKSGAKAADLMQKFGENLSGELNAFDQTNIVEATQKALQDIALQAEGVLTPENVTQLQVLMKKSVEGLIRKLLWFDAFGLAVLAALLWGTNGVRKSNKEEIQNINERIGRILESLNQLQRLVEQPGADIDLLIEMKNGIRKDLILVEKSIQTAKNTAFYTGVVTSIGFVAASLFGFANAVTAVHSVAVLGAAAAPVLTVAAFTAVFGALSGSFAWLTYEFYQQICQLKGLSEAVKKLQGEVNHVLSGLNELNDI